jgi:ABC-2 type transport system permease protein
MAFPIVISLAVGIIFSGSGKMLFNVGVVNQAGEAGQPLIDGFDQQSAFNVFEGTQEDELDALRRGQRDIVLIIPDTVEVTGPVSDPADQIPLGVYYDPNAINSTGAFDLLQETVFAVGVRMTGNLPPFAVQPQTTSINRLRSSDYMLPGVLALSMMLLGLYVTAVPLVSLREHQVLRRMGVTPLSRLTMLLAQVAFRLTVALIQALVVIMISVVIFDLPLVTGNLPGIIALVLLGAAVFITLGYFLAGIARSEEAIQFLIGLIFLLFTMMSGVLVPLWRMPGWIKPLVNAIPLTYLADGLRQLMVDATPAYSLMTDILVLVGCLVVTIFLAHRFFSLSE